MKLIDLLKVMDDHTFLTLDIIILGMTFETRHQADLFLSQGAGLMDREVDLIYITNGELHVRLKH